MTTHLNNGSGQRKKNSNTNLRAKILFIAYSHHVGGEISDHYWEK